MNQQDSLEKQLEMLFSDTGLPESMTGPSLRADAPSAVATPTRKSLSGTMPQALPKLRSNRSLQGLIVFSLVLVLGFTIVERGILAQPVPTITRRLSLSVATVPALPAATITPLAVIPTTLSTTAHLLETATTTPFSPVPSATPTTVTAAVTATTTPTSYTITNETATETATDVPATPTPVPPTPTATATLAPVRRVYTSTITPVPASVIGLESIPTPVPLVPMPDQAINIVLLGSDQRPYETQWRTDVVIVVSVNPDLPSVSMLTIPRDTWLYIPNWTYQRINLADIHGTLVGYPGGGPGLVKATLEYNLGIHVDYFARVNFAGLMRIVDTLGGIDVLIDCPVEDGFPDDPITEDPSVVTQISYPEPGLYHIDGKHALWLSRSRKTTSEFARSRRQHRILQAIWTKANQLGFISRLPELWEDLTATVETDLTLEQVLWLASIGLQLDASQIHSGFIDGRYLTAWVSPGGANVLLPDTEAILEALEPIFNPYPLQAPQGFSKVEVWNGSGHKDWGLLAADKLLRHGFEVTAIRSTDELYENSTLLDFTTDAKGSPLPLLQSLFNAQLAHAVAEAQDGVSFHLTVGADYQPCEWPTLPRWTPPTPVPQEQDTIAP